MIVRIKRPRLIIKYALMMVACYLFFHLQLESNKTQEMSGYYTTDVANHSDSGTENNSSSTNSDTRDDLNKYSQWQPVNLLNSTLIYFYSAYQDNRVKSQRLIRILGLARNKFKLSLTCLLEDENGEIVEGSHAIIRQNKEHWNLPWSSFFFICPIPSNISVAQQVCLILKSQPDHNCTWQKVSNIELEDTAGNVGQEDGHLTQRPVNLGVCVKPFHYSYDRAVWLLEFLHLYKLLGVNHFFFYNNTVGPNVEAVLRHFIKNGEVTLLEWNLPLQSQTEVRNQAQFSALNDCIYRTMTNFTYIAMVDVDEYILPKNDKDLLTMLQRHDEEKVGSFIFKNAFFYLYQENDTLTSEIRDGQEFLYLLTMYKTKRLKKLHNYGTRSKYITKPKAVIEVGNHLIWEHLKGYKPKNIPEAVALSHHYRICEFGGFDCMNKTFVEDDTSMKWRDELFRDVTASCWNIFPESGCPPAPPLGSPW